MCLNNLFYVINKMIYLFSSFGMIISSELEYFTTTRTSHEVTQINGQEYFTVFR